MFLIFNCLTCLCCQIDLLFGCILFIDFFLFFLWISSCSSTILERVFPFLFEFLSVCVLVKNHLTIYVNYIFKHCSVPLIFLSILSSQTYCLVFCSFIQISEVKVRSSNFGLFQESFNYPWSFAFPNTF